MWLNIMILDTGHFCRCNIDIYGRLGTSKGGRYSSRCSKKPWLTLISAKNFHLIPVVLPFSLPDITLDLTQTFETSPVGAGGGGHCCGPGSGIRCLIDPWIRDLGWVPYKIRIRIRDEQPGSYFRQLRNIFWG
jgi:hypothetical protein